MCSEEGERQGLGSGEYRGLGGGESPGDWGILLMKNVN